MRANVVDSSSGAARRFHHPNLQVGTYPTLMVPAFGVPSSIILHGLSLWQLRRSARKTALHTQQIGTLISRARRSEGTRRLPRDPPRLG